MISACVLSAGMAEGQSVNLFRSSVIVNSYTTVGDAIAASVAGDSLVISAHTFKESNLSINKNLKLTGTSGAGGSTVIDANLKSRALLISTGNVTIQDITFTNGRVNNDAGGGICNYGSGQLILTGNSAVTSSACTGIYANGGGIFSSGRLVISGNTIISGNSSSEDGGGVYAYGTFVLSGNAKISNNTTKGSGGGAFSRANGGSNLTDFAIIENNTAAVAGGGLYGVGTLSRHASITNNKAEFGGGIAAFNDNLFLQDTVQINNNTATTSGAGIWLNNCSMFAQGSFSISNNTIPAVTGTLNFGGAIYNVNGSILINGGTIKGNKSPIAAIYNTAATAATQINLHATHMYNPAADGTRIPEVLNSPSFSTSSILFTSDTCWWGSNDTTKLVANRPGTYSGNISSFVKINWVLNNGTPVDPSMSTFPLRAEFKMNDGSKFDSLRLRSIKGMFSASKGSFNQDNPKIDSLNFIRSIYSATSSADTTMITAIVDADTFRTEKLAVKGLSIIDKNLSSNIKIYPNPATETIYISDAAMGSTVRIYDLQGKMLVQQTVQNTTEQIDLNKIPSGMYLVQLITTDGQKSTARIIKQ